MNKLSILKGASEILTSIGVSAIVGNVIKLTADPEAGKIKKIAIGFGGFVLSSMVADKAVDYANERIDKTADSLSKIFKPKATEDEADTQMAFDFNEIEGDDALAQDYQNYLQEQNDRRVEIQKANEALLKDEIDNPDKKITKTKKESDK